MDSSCEVTGSIFQRTLVTLVKFCVSCCRPSEIFVGNCPPAKNILVISHKNLEGPVNGLVLGGLSE